MNRLEMEALANLLNGWGLTDTPTGTAGAGEIDVLIAGRVDNYCLHVSEPVVFVRDSALAHV